MSRFFTGPFSQKSSEKREANLSTDAEIKPLLAGIKNQSQYLSTSALSSTTVSSAASSAASIPPRIAAPTEATPTTRLPTELWSQIAGFLDPKSMQALALSSSEAATGVKHNNNQPKKLLARQKEFLQLGLNESLVNSLFTTNNNKIEFLTMNDSFVQKLRELSIKVPLLASTEFSFNLKTLTAEDLCYLSGQKKAIDHADLQNKTDALRRIILLLLSGNKLNPRSFELASISTLISSEEMQALLSNAALGGNFDNFKLISNWLRNLPALDGEMDRKLDRNQQEVRCFENGLKYSASSRKLPFYFIIGILMSATATALAFAFSPALIALSIPAAVFSGIFIFIAFLMAWSLQVIIVLSEHSNNTRRDDPYYEELQYRAFAARNNRVLNAAAASGNVDLFMYVKKMVELPTKTDHLGSLLYFACLGGNTGIMRSIYKCSFLYFLPTRTTWRIKNTVDTERRNLADLAKLSGFGKVHGNKEAVALVRSWGISPRALIWSAREAAVSPTVASSAAVEEAARVLPEHVAAPAVAPAPAEDDEGEIERAALLA